MILDGLRRFPIPLVFLIPLFMIIWGCGGGLGSRGDEKLCQGPGATVSGTATFENRVVGLNGYTGQRTFQAIRFAGVEVIQNSSGAVIKSGATDGGGYFCVDFGLEKGDVYVSVSAKTNHPNYNLQVRTLSDRESSIYSIQSNLFNDNIDGKRITKDLRARVNTGVAGAFKILDVFEFGVDFTRELTGIQKQPLPLRGLWNRGVEAITGWNRDPIGAFIQVNGGGNSADPDEYDAGVLLHEFGHYMTDVYSKDVSPGGPHSGFDNTVDIRLAYSEGWASFISGAMRRDRFVVNAFGDDPPNNGAGVIDLESTTPFAKQFVFYTTNEIAVAKTLWDIFDNNTVSESFDQIATGITPIWDVMVNYFTRDNVTATSMEDFWEGWFIRGHGFLPELLAIAQEFKMDFFEDFYETLDGGDDLSPNIQEAFPVNSLEEHILYPDGDVDYIPFKGEAGQIFTILTNFLKNGADTYLEIFDSNGNPLFPRVTNDNQDGVTNENPDGQTYASNCGDFGAPACPPNDATALSSRIDFTAPSTDLFYVRVSRSPNAPPSSGRFGTYTILIASP